MVDNFLPLIVPVQNCEGNDLTHAIFRAGMRVLLPQVLSKLQKARKWAFKHH